MLKISKSFSIILKFPSFLKILKWDNYVWKYQKSILHFHKKMNFLFTEFYEKKTTKFQTTETYKSVHNIFFSYLIWKMWKFSIFFLYFRTIVKFFFVLVIWAKCEPIKNWRYFLENFQLNIKIKKNSRIAFFWLQKMILQFHYFTKKSFYNFTKNNCDEFLTSTWKYQIIRSKCWKWISTVAQIPR